MLALLALGPGAGEAEAKSYAPSRGKAYHGVSDTGRVRHFDRFRQEVRAHPAVIQAFEPWNFEIPDNFDRWRKTDTRGMLSISTAPGYQEPEKISPFGIAHGRGDGFPLRLGKSLARWGDPVYIRFLPEMNGHWNPYCAFNSNGSRRDKQHSTKQFRKAWKRFVLIVRGGAKRRINRKLRRMGLPKIQKDAPRRLPRPDVAFMFVPQTSGSPNIKKNGPRDYWPGGRYVDWVGADMYAKFPNFDGLNRFYRNFPRKPFVIGEYSPWDRDDPSFIKHLFRWSKNHRRAKMLVYFQGFITGDHLIQNYPRSRRALRQILNRDRYDPFAPGAKR